MDAQIREIKRQFPYGHEWYRIDMHAGKRYGL